MDAPVVYVGKSGTDIDAYTSKLADHIRFTGDDHAFFQFNGNDFRLELVGDKDYIVRRTAIFGY